ncbi:MAG: CoA transferase subunit A [Clostridium sulfidigenes]|uniref:CoA transferase subunit A n=1 Tax=Clostridium sulfidigenes TaxID=318464 RepID=A0A927WGK4_9CLOT|nr:CoA transferase subunit A [Clostridium sulfidigenes]
MNKVMTMHDAVAKYVESGDSICFGGFTTNRKPYAAVYEILRQGQKNFTVWAGPAGGDWDMLIGEKRVQAYINCYTANSGYTNVSRRFRAAIEEGELIFEDYSQDVIMLQLHAASLGLPYLPVRLMQGSGLTDFWGISKEARKTLDKLDNDKFVEVENPFSPGEKVIAVPVPRLDTAIIHVQKASPDGTCIIEGDEFHDVDIAIAGKKVIVTCEELVSDEFIRRDPSLTKVFSECVSAVVHAPFGAWPAQCYNYYDVDGQALKEYDEASKYADDEDAENKLIKQAIKKGIEYNPNNKPETFKDFVKKWVYSVKDHNELLDKIGGARLMSIKNVPGLGYAGKVQ